MEQLISEGKTLLTIENGRQLREYYEMWCSKVKIFLINERISEKKQAEIMLNTHYTDNEYSEENTKVSIKKAIKNTIFFLTEMNRTVQNGFSEEISIAIIERILQNFYMYFQAMYRSSIHKSSSFTQDILESIQICNEYDLQRMLYSLLLPVFPTIRQEVDSDNGYKGMRFDIYLKEIHLVIETKCTRKNLSEKQLTEELGADIFHYRAKTIFILVFDKNCIIKNPEALKEAFKRDYENDGKTVKLFITQPIKL